MAELVKTTDTKLRLQDVQIVGFRSIKALRLTLDDFAPIVGYNNAGKSNILSAISWVLRPSATNRSDFNSPDELPLNVTATITGITPELLNSMPANQQKQIGPFIKDQKLQIARMMNSPGAASTADLLVRDPAVVEDKDKNAWKANPTGIDNALKVLFPEPIHIHAMEDAADDVCKSSKASTIGKLLAGIIEPIRKSIRRTWRQH